MTSVVMDRLSTAFLASLAACFLLVGSAVGVGWWILTRPVPPAAGAEQTVYDRGDFTSQVLGQTEQEVEERVGRPDNTSKDSQAVYWHYRRRTRDPVSGEVDTDAQLVFRDGKVVSVNY